MNFSVMAILSCHVAITSFVAEQVKTIIHLFSCVAFLVEMVLYKPGYKVQHLLGPVLIL